MLEQAQRMARLIDDLLSLSRLEMRAHVAPEGEVDLGRTVTHVVDTLKPMASDLGVEIELALPPDPALVTGDVDELIQVFSNLIENACKYGQTGKRVEITVAESEAEGAHVTVRDFGPGIAKEHVPRLTERFYRVDVETSRAQKRGPASALPSSSTSSRGTGRGWWCAPRRGKDRPFTVKFSPRRLWKTLNRWRFVQLKTMT
jgi:two-component system phosphate regulon sensor histidine kinase PhoR